jgi:hypothetical protein
MLYTAILLAQTPSTEETADADAIVSPRAAVLHVATHPAGPDAIELVWELSDSSPPPAKGSRQRCVATFSQKGQMGALAGKKFEISAGFDGKTYRKIAVVEGPLNKYVHTGVTPGWLYYYRIAAREPSGSLLAESAPVYGAAGKDLFRLAGFEDEPLGAVYPDFKKGRFLHAMPEAYRIVRGARPYSNGSKVLSFRPTEKRPDGSPGQIVLKGGIVPIAPDKMYLQGGWVHGGRTHYGRYFHDANAARAGDDGQLHKTSAVGWGYVFTYVSGDQWTFGVQLLTIDADGTGFPREGKVGHARNELAKKPWTFPPDAAFMRFFITSFGSGEFDDPWLLEVKHAPKDASVLPGGEVEHIRYTGAEMPE